MSSDDIAISVRNLSKTYRLFNHPGDRVKQFFSLGLKQYHREFTALNDVSFDIKKGETIGIIGRNGSGKSTLLQLICGILKPTSGTVTVNGRISALLELGAGFNPEFTGRENVYFQGALMGFTRAQMEARFDDIAAFADIGEFIDQPVRTYSSGMYVRLAFATMIHVDADILVIDEAIAVGDAAFTQKCMSFLEQFRLRGTLLLVSHDQASIMALCDKVVWLQGRLLEIGEPYAVIEAYIGAALGWLPKPALAVGAADVGGLVDQRQLLINASNLRNDLAVFSFDPSEAGMGSGYAHIIDTWLEDADGGRFSLIVGGEPATLVIRVRAEVDLQKPVLGFVVRDRMGRALIGDNTYLSYATDPVTVASGQVLEARFSFCMPRFPTGEYVVCVTVADGVPGMHQILHRINQALTLRAEASSVSQVLVGLPMQRIELKNLF